MRLRGQVGRRCVFAASGKRIPGEKTIFIEDAEKSCRHVFSDK